ncbi:MAG: esterase family protein [Acidimicrobiia bacterium]|nr:esterase family protein [Acidimicrobiia bacterium]
MKRVLLALVLTSACASEPGSWRDLRAHVATLADRDARDAAIERFIASKGGTPIIEHQTRLVFLVKDRDGQPPRIVGDFNAWAVSPQGYDTNIGKATRIEGSSWSFVESTSYTNARLEYGLLFDQEYATDPNNRRIVQAFAGPRSEVRMPFFVTQPEVDELGPQATPPGPQKAQIAHSGQALKGELIAENVASRSLGGSRRVWYYLPPGYAAAPETLFPVVYVLDGSNFVEKMEVPRILDHLIANKSIPPVIAVFSEPADRQEEYSRNPRWRAFITEELVPMVDKRFRTFPTPDHRVILGSSLAAYGAVDLAVSAPSVFGLCAAIAPPTQAATVVANQAHARAAVVSITFFVLGGVYDSMIDGARLLRTTLDEYLAPVTYLEVSEGHNTNTFRGHLDDALRALLPAQ